VLAICECRFADFTGIDVLSAARLQIDFIHEHATYEFSLAFIRQWLGEGLGENLEWIALRRLLEQLGNCIEMALLVVEHALPNAFDARIGFLQRTAPIVVNLHRLMHQPLLEEGLRWIEQRFVLRHVLFFYRGDFCIQLTRERIGE
jgi:hypothetical protein